VEFLTAAVRRFTVRNERHETVQKPGLREAYQSSARAIDRITRFYVSNATLALRRPHGCHVPVRVVAAGDAPHSHYAL
jgi:hypothetical protein